MWSHPFLPRKAADNVIMASCRRTALGFSKIEGPKSLTLRSRSFLGHSRDVVATVSA